MLRQSLNFRLRRTRGDEQISIDFSAEPIGLRDLRAEQLFRDCAACPVPVISSVLQALALRRQPLAAPALTDDINSMLGLALKAVSLRLEDPVDLLEKPNSQFLEVLPV
jgi:hypothetical protein